MDWAKDLRGVIVQPARGAYFGFGLTCPCCGEDVYLRSGQTRRPHFAHYSNRAKPECEFYYPPPEVLRRTVSRLLTKDSTLLTKRDSLRSGLFLAYRPDLPGFELFVRIPSLASVGQLSGSLEIQHGKGVKTFTATQFTRAYTVSVSPTVPLLECDGTGDLSGLAVHLMAQTSSFAHGMNLFTATESGGRLLYAREPLEWGGRYWIVTDVPISPPDKVTEAVEWIRRGSLAKWHVYEVELPATFIASRFHTTKESLTEFFGLLIRPRQPRAYVVYPSPHHLGADGAYVYPQSPEVLYILRTSNHDVSVVGSPDLIAEIQIVALADNWIQIEGIQPSTQDVAILINGVEQVVIRIETCDLIQPDGLRAYSGEISWSLLEDVPLLPDQLFSQDIRIECGSDRLANYVSKIKEGSILDGSAIILPKNTDKTLRVGGFGEIRPSAEHAENQDASPKELNWRKNGPLPKATWIQGVVCAKYGPQTASLVTDFIADPSQLNLKKLGPIITSPLMAYIRAAVEQQ